VVIPPVVLVELFDPKLSASVSNLLKMLRLLEQQMVIGSGQEHYASRHYVEAGKARLADTLIAQTCLDHDIPSSRFTETYGFSSAESVAVNPSAGRTRRVPLGDHARNPH